MTKTISDEAYAEFMTFQKKQTDRKAKSAKRRAVQREVLKKHKSEYDALMKS